MIEGNFKVPITIDKSQLEDAAENAGFGFCSKPNKIEIYKRISV